MKTPQSGFTLFELMVGISIMGILVSLAVPTFQDFGRNARVVAAQNDIVTALNYSRSRQRWPQSRQCARSGAPVSGGSSCQRA